MKPGASEIAYVTKGKMKLSNKWFSNSAKEGILMKVTENKWKFKGEGYKTETVPSKDVEKAMKEYCNNFRENKWCDIHGNVNCMLYGDFCYGLDINTSSPFLIPKNYLRNRTKDPEKVLKEEGYL